MIEIFIIRMLKIIFNFGRVTELHMAPIHHTHHLITEMIIPMVYYITYGLTQNWVSTLFRIRCIPCKVNSTKLKGTNTVCRLTRGIHGLRVSDEVKSGIS